MSYLCVDIGGVSLKYGILDSSGKILLLKVLPTPKTLGTFKDALRKIINDNRQRINGISISAPAMVDYENLAFYNCEGLPFINGISMEDILGPENSKIIVKVESEGRAATTAEVWDGALKDVDSGILLTLGNSVTGGLAIDGNYIAGAHQKAGLFSLIRDELNVPGSQGLVRSNCSAINMIRAINVVDKHDDVYDGPHAFGLIEAGDKAALSIFNNFCKNIAQLMFNMQLLVDVQRFAIGGGISSNELVIKTIKNAYTDIVAEFPQAQQVLVYPEIVTAKHSRETMIKGVLYCYMEQVNNER